MDISNGVLPRKGIVKHPTFQLPEEVTGVGFTRRKARMFKESSSR